MKRIFGLSLVAVVAFATITALCAWTSSCGTSLHKASVAADSIANSLKTAADLNQSLYAQGQISLVERQQVAALIGQTAHANDDLVQQLKTAESNGGQVTAATIVQAFNTFLTQLNGLQTNGVLHLKSTTAQASFQTILTAVQFQVSVIETLIGTTSSRNQTPLPTRPNSGYLLFAALALTPDEIAALIALATTALGEGAALVQKLLAMKGESDAALLADAATEDAAAETEAQTEQGAV